MLIGIDTNYDRWVCNQVSN